MISRNFIKSSLIYTLAGTLPMASAVILLPFYIGFLSTARYGELSIYLSISLVAQILITFSFDTSVYLYYHEFKTDMDKLGKYLSTAFGLIVVGGLLFVLMMMVLGPFFFSFIAGEREFGFYPFGFMAVITAAFQSLFKVHTSLLQTREKPIEYFWSNIIFFTMVAAFTIGGLTLFHNSLIGPIAGRMLAVVIMGSWSLVKVAREFGVHYEYQFIKPTLTFNMDSWIYQLQQWLINYFDRFVLLGYMTMADVGVYDFALKCLLVIEFVLNGLHNSFFPKVVSIITSNKQKQTTAETNRYYHGLTSVIMLLICVCILLFPLLISAFIEKDAYMEASKYIPLLSVVYVFRVMRLYFAAPYGIIKYTRPMPWIYMIVAAVKIALMLLLIKEYGIYGIITASLISAVVELILTRVGLSGRFEFHFNLFKILLAPILLFTLIVVTEIILGPSMVLHLSFVVCCLVLLWWAYRNELRLINPFKRASG